MSRQLVVNTRVVVVGGSDAGISFLEKLVYVREILNIWFRHSVRSPARRADTSKRHPPRPPEPTPPLPKPDPHIERRDPAPRRRGWVRDAEMLHILGVS